MKRLIFLVLFALGVLFGAGSSYAQEDCPSVSVTCPDFVDGRNTTFDAHVGWVEPANSYKWTVSGGSIIRGVGTSSVEIKVDRRVRMVTATVECGFPIKLPDGCNLTASCSVIVVPPGYPTHWWGWVTDPNKPGWEILPQEAKPGEVILSKRNELGLLSNFAATPFTFRGKRYASLEGFWQAMLYPEGPKDPRAKFPGLEWKYTREQVTQMTAFEAKHAGDLAEENMRKMKIGWVSFEGKRFAYRPKKPGQHYRLIVVATWAKVLQNENVKQVLLATGDLKLKPDHHQEPNAPAAWRYFDIWMRIRKELQNRER